MLEATDIKVIDNGDLFLGKLDEKEIILAMVIGDATRMQSKTENIADRVDRDWFRSYIMQQNVPGQLQNITLSVNSDVSSRPLSDEEKADYDSLMVLFKQAEKIAIPLTVNKEFQRLGK